MRFELSDGVVAVRRYRVDDAAELYAAARESIDAIYPWMEWCHPNYALHETEEWVGRAVAGWGDGAEYPMLAVATDGGRILGSSGVNKIDDQHRSANLGYWVRTSEAGRGVATRAACLVAEVALTELDLRRLEIVAAVGNEASRRVAEKTGATFEGIMRHGLFIHGRAHDAALYSLTRDDLPALRAGRESRGEDASGTPR